MPQVLYRCPKCGHEQIEYLSINDTYPTEVHVPGQCEEGPTCRHERVWSAVAVGPVQGAGGSPARYPGVK